MYKKFQLGFIICLTLAACGDDRPPLPTEKEAARFVGAGTSATGSSKTKLLSVDCDYADPPKSTKTGEWMGRCDFRVSVEEWNFQARRYDPPIERNGDFLIFWKENVTHDGQGAWEIGY